MERVQARSISLCVRKSVPLQTPEITLFFVFAIYKKAFSEYIRKCIVIYVHL